MRRAAPALLLAVLLAACGQAEVSPRAPDRDPASEQALGDQIMVDPDLANQNEGNAALTVSSDHALPLVVATPEAIAAARADAAVMVGGSDKLTPPPEPLPLGDRVGNGIVTPAQFAARLPGAAECEAELRYSASWAARLPEALPVYPRGATLDAAGSDREGCRLRIVTFVTPVAPDDVLAFYDARAAKARFTIEHFGNGSNHVLAGRRGAAAFRLALRARDDGLTEATLATIGS